MLRRIPTYAMGNRAAPACAALLVAITVLRFVVGNPMEAVGFLYVVPISLAAMEWGWRGGVAVAAAAMGLTAAWALLRDVPLGVMAYGIRASMFGGVGALVGLQAEERRALLAERGLLVEELAASAMRDQLTGLANRRAWEERFRHELESARRSGAPLSVAVVDLDGLKAVNDSFGHAEGDRLIERCAYAWSDAVREIDFIARLGGDEFFVLLPDCGEPGAAEVAQRLLTAVDGEDAFSIGIATWDGVESGDELIGRADRAMYAAKARGGAQAAFAADALAG